MISNPSKSIVALRISLSVSALFIIERENSQVDKSNVTFLSTEISMIDEYKSYCESPLTFGN